MIEKVLASVEYVMRPEDLATLRDMSKDQCLLYFLELLDEKKREVSQLQETLKACYALALYPGSLLWHALL